MTKYLVSVVTLIVCVVSVNAHAAKKDSTPVYPHYWMSIATSNQSIPGMSEQMSGFASMFSGKSGFGPRRSLQLQLESPRQVPEKTEALHNIPAGQNMGKSLQLLTPEPAKETREVQPTEREKPEKVEKPKARMLIYWGCGETVRKGQPKVIDTEKMDMVQFGKALAGRSPTPQYPPSVRSGWVYGEWPNKEDSKDIPKDSSLIGEHLIHGNYVKDIRFNIDQKRDFMAPVEFTTLKSTPNGAMKVEWKSIPTATGYFATVMAHNSKTEETIFWSSSEVYEPGFALMNYLTNSDVQRFIKEKVVMSAGTTSCTLPPVFKDVAGAIQFIAYGEEMNIIFPPKPKDPKKPWNPEWSVKVRLKSTGMTPLMETQERKDPSRKAKSSRPDDESDSSDRKDKEDSGASGSPMNKIKGMFGF
jgi:hypothetical protein